MRVLAFVAAVGAVSIAAAPASAHPHTIAKNGQVLANGATHGSPTFDPEDLNWEICDADAATYGLEVAHHGPDADRDGASDGCYEVEGGLTPGNPAADRNPAIN